MENRPFITGEGGPNKRSPRSLKEMPEEVGLRENTMINNVIYRSRRGQNQRSHLQIWPKMNVLFKGGI